MDDNNNMQNQEPAGKSSSTWIIVLVVLIIAAGAYALNRNRAGDAGKAGQGQEKTSNPAFGNNAADQAEVKTFVVDAKPFSFSPSEIRVKKGDKVKILLNNIQGFHDWVADEFNARTKQITGPATAEVEFIADKEGAFEFYCGVGEHRKMGMIGVLIVE